jgi:hypothetical protein
MKKITILNLLCCLVLLSCGQQQKPTENMKYNIKRTDYIKGTYKTFSYELKNDSIVVTRFSTNNLPPKLLYSDVLNAKQKSELSEILNSFDLPNMKTQYVNNNVEGEGHSVYDIKINQDFKSIYVYFVEEPSLKKLDDYIYKLLPANQDGWSDVY